MLIARWRDLCEMEFAPQGTIRARSAASAFGRLLPQVRFVRGWPSLVALAVACWFSSAASAGVDVWTPIGPQGGRVMSVVSDPSTSTRLYATDVNADIYRSNDAGTTWTRITPPQPSIPGCGFPQLVVQSDGAVYAATCNGIYKSADTGVSWVQQGLPDATLAGDPTNPLVLYALARTGARLNLFKTTNGGATWSPLNLFADDITQILVDATLPSRLYALSQNSGVWRSVDDGLTWDPINTGLPSAPLNSLAQSGSTVFVATGGFGVFKLVDGGASWTAADGGIATQTIEIVRAGSGSTLYAAAQSSSIFPFTTVNTPFFRSTDGGGSWLPIGTLGAQVTDFAVSRQSNSILYAATSRGLATSSDAGASWTFDPNNGLPNAPVPGLYLDASRAAVLYASSGSSFRGGYKSFDHGAQWSSLVRADGTPFTPIAASPTRSGTVYGAISCTAFNCGIFRTTDFGNEWTSILPTYRTSVTALLEAPNPAGTLFALGSQYGGLGFPTAVFVMRSDDGGVSWSDASSGLPGYPDPNNQSVGAATMDPTNSNVLYAGVDNSVYKTVDGGGLWVNASGGLPQSRVNALAVSPPHPNTIFAGLGDPQSAPALYGLYRSDDGGTTWGPRNTAFVNLAITALAFDPSNPSNVYAGTAGGGLYRSTDGGTTFRPINYGLADVDSLSVNAIAGDPVDGRNLYIGTDGGAFALTIDRYDSFVPVIEFYWLEADHYFIASELQADVPALDSGAFAGWTRTGRTFKAYPQPAGAAQPVCRFYIPPQHGDSHFYSASVSECAAVLDASTNPANPAYPNYSGYVYETPSSFFVDIPANGSCPPGELPVFRLWNRRFDSNHRYTTDPAIRDAMIARGYVLEGVVMCALQ